ncbi:3-deoxy-manno-octulosonate cytidylyltransferase [BD1-7 clade bacterium]|uniref:3-deoxy-manno-octulosonate cytidylyltransferase n=1 Tax=BD1-7 clade bacterium TaxID=2029982 RepID=A0A5S9NUK8_9GAMM|nr:3-deoxy-manno-octulosonate cytidylyltransferase [BD1-7 clade bacterium]CAA0094319.1 3-deoxy-manno-octulosonate cytidylyltransferase [BD1-7 clade bacterium]
MDFVVVIPSRYASSRLPAKPLADICGKPMIQHVWEQACLSNATDVIIATDDSRIEAAANAFGARVCMTREDHESGTDRLQEVAQNMGYDEDQVIVNVQGDEPLIPPAVINQVAALLSDETRQMATLCETIEAVSHVFDPNVVKLVTDNSQQALYFSRAPIPWVRDAFAENREELPVGVEFKRHIGIYAYRAALLNRFVDWPLGTLESIEKLEQLRVMENGVSIFAEAACQKIPAGVDTQEDLDAVRNYLTQQK